MVTKRDLAKKVSEKAGISIDAANKAVSAVLDGISYALVDGEKVQLPGFGAFEVRERAARNGKNPKTKEAIIIPASKAVVFKPYTALKDVVNK